MADRLIHILPEQVASRIAAGEVVERPASALKELVENSLDAGAKSIGVEIEHGGARLIAVSDDGCGMSREDAVLAIRRHATSKIRDAQDLAAIRTLGFRGEALASIASVARFRMLTRRAADLAGVEIVADGCELTATRECAAAPGTRIEVRDLFFNTPARLKFLKTTATEQSAAAEAVQRLALAHWRVAFRFDADGRTLYELPRVASPLERFRQLFGPRLAARMLHFDEPREGLRAFGLVSTSQESYPTPRMVFTFVNGRVVRDRMLQRAIAQAYETLVPRGRYPAAVLFVELRPAEVDVNVHPMKTEVRFRNSRAIFEAIYHALLRRLADQTTSTPPPVVPQRPEPIGALIVQSDASSPLRLVPDSPARAGAEQRALGLGWGRSTAPEVAALHEGSGGNHQVANDPPAGPSNHATALTPGDARVVPAGEPPGAAAQPGIPMYSRLRVVGQLFAGYIALEGEEGLILVDQHAAHERVTFEKLRAEVAAGGIRTQALLTPVPIEVSPARAPQVRQALSELHSMGFSVEPFGPATLLLKGVPAVFGVEDGARLLSEMIDAMGEDGFRMRGTAAFDDLLKQLACHGSVRVGRVLKEPEIAALLQELDNVEFKTNCPHGRPVHIRWGRGQIERMFRR